MELYHVPGSGGFADISGWTVRLMQDPDYILDYVLPPSTVLDEGLAVGERRVPVSVRIGRIIV